MDHRDSLMQIKRYDVHHHLLKRLIKFFWVVTSDHEAIMPYKLVPVNNIDIVLNFSAPITYTSAQTREIRVQGCHFSGIRTQSSLVEHSGRPDMIGISFFPLGLYPFLKTPLSEFTDTTIELDLLNKEFIERVGEQFTGALSISFAKPMASIHGHSNADFRPMSVSARNSFNGSRDFNTP